MPSNMDDIIATDITTGTHMLYIAVALGITVFVTAIGVCVFLTAVYRRKSKVSKNDSPLQDSELGEDNLMHDMGEDIELVTRDEVAHEQHSNGDTKQHDNGIVANGSTKKSTNILTKPCVTVKPTVQNDPYIEVGEETSCMVRIPVINLKQHIEKLGQINGFQKEYQRLPADKCFAWGVAEKKENKLKNRYRGIMAYDHSRVILDTNYGDSFTDYINANYAPNYNRNKAFVASQGPTEQMVKDFWRMIWQLKVSVVVMTTNVFEDEKMKCVQYWPSDGNVVFGDISVTMEEENTQRHHAVRKLKFVKDNEEGIVTHFHFTSWPDHGVPESYSPLVNFWHLVRSHTSQMVPAPVLVHCSAGIGRTGTFIALDYLLDQAMEEQHVDVPACVNKLRQYRVNMVQKDVQYQFLYNAVYHGFYVGKTLVSENEFCNSNLPTAMMDANLKKQFKMLMENSHIEEDESEEILNDSSDITTNSVQYKSPVTGMTMIVTQHPTNQDSVRDFWKMIQEMKCSAIVTMQPRTKSSSQWWPTPDTPVILVDGQQVVNIRSSSMAKCEDVTVTELCVTSGSGEYVNVKHAEPEHDDEDIYMNVNENNEETLLEHSIRCHTMKCISPESICETWEASGKSKTSHNETICIMCGDGHSESGAVVTGYMLLDDLTKYKQVDVYETVKQIRKYSPEAIKDVAQYESLYKVVERAVKSGASNTK